MPLICQKCNSTIPENNKFCGSCGEPIEELLDATPLNEVTEESSVETLSLDELLTGETIQQSPWAWMLPIIPWMIFVIGVQGEQFNNWLWQGFIIDLALGYPAGKLLLYFKDKIHSLCRLDEA